MKHYPKKRFGQNFLQDQAIIAQIIAVLALKNHDNVIEIGPGMGALTGYLLTELDKLQVIEIDRDLIAYLQQTFAHTHLHIHHADALTMDYGQWGGEARIVGNLPYNISTPLILHLLNYVQNIKDMHFMLQKEVVQRLAACPGTKHYGRLSVMVQYHCQAIELFDVPAAAFFPKPKVNSAIIRLIPYNKSPYPNIDVRLLEQVVARAFNMRRKTLANNLKGLISREQITALGVDANKRPEQLEVLDFIHLTECVASTGEYRVPMAY
ncbi:MAG: 16S rRNA (adenine(1518)-N(6)/adenine(1519)-N(6))-dimethyltransferase [Legionellaceae bacterium]|nr:16S rRNA (adenine(1518)-N(6)/adenine(1519)-N(6))-dimethyltransferase [Legionellaceae bacterium]HCA88910.1 16S rRNA (adenine(1518)-N(6)/adenine(1519)-N(6))-dimethyltransferase [Legionellales bacterium]